MVTGWPVAFMQSQPFELGSALLETIEDLGVAVAVDVGDAATPRSPVNEVCGAAKRTAPVWPSKTQRKHSSA